MKVSRSSLRRPLSYTGISAPTPLNFVIEDHAPSNAPHVRGLYGAPWRSRDSLGTLWLVLNDTPPPLRELYMLTNILGNTATWVQLYPALSEGALYFPTDAGQANSLLGVLKVYGGINIYTEGVDNSITINLKDNITLAGTLSIPALASGIITVDILGVVGSSKGSDGELLIGSDIGEPDWNQPTPSDATLVFAYGNNTIDITTNFPPPAGETNAVQTDSGVATSNALHVTFFLGEPLNFNTSAAGNTLTINLNDDITISGDLTLDLLTRGVVFSDGAGLISSANGINGQLIIGNTASGIPLWGDLTCPDGTVIIDKAANYIELRVPTGILNQIDGDVGSSVPDGLGVIYIEGGDNINTTAAGSVVIINLDTSILQPNTNATGTEGVYSIDSVKFLHNYGGANTFIGRNVSNLTSTGDYNVGIGTDALLLLTTGNYNTVAGHLAGDNIDSESNSICIGALSSLNSSAGSTIAIGYNNLNAEVNAVQIGSCMDFKSSDSVIIGSDLGTNEGSSYITGIGASVYGSIGSGLYGTDIERTLAIGYNAGANMTNYIYDQIAIGNAGSVGDFSDHDQNIYIGTEGSGVGQQDSTHIAGIYNETVSDKPVLINSSNKLGTDRDLFDLDGEILIGRDIDWHDNNYPFATEDLSDLLYGSVYNAGLYTNRMIATGSGGKLSHTTDGVNWTEDVNTYLGGNNLTSIVKIYANYWLVGSSGADPQKLMYGNNGTSWTVDATMTDNVTALVVRGEYTYACTESSGVYVDQYGIPLTWVSIGGPNNVCSGTDYGSAIYVVDGTTDINRYNHLGWVVVFSAASNLKTIRYSSTAGLFVAAGENGVLYTSTNGGTWTSRTSSFGVTTINDVFYDGGTWKTVGDSGKIATSSDGITWTQEVNDLGVNNINCITFFSAKNWIAIGVNDHINTKSSDRSSTDANRIESNTGTIDVTYGSNAIYLETNLGVVPERPAFFLMQTVDELDVTGDGVMHYLFQTPANYNKIVDNKSDWNAGGYYLAKADSMGKWFVMVSIHLGDLVLPPPPPPITPCNDPLIIETTNRTYSLINPMLELLGTQTLFLSAVVDLGTLHTCKFGFGVDLPIVGKRLDILAGSFCAGYRIE